MVSLIQDPNGEKIFEKTGETDVSMTNRRIGLAEEQGSRITQLEAKIAQLEAEMVLANQV